MASKAAIFSRATREAYTENSDTENSKKYFIGYYPSIAANSSGNLVCAYSYGIFKYHVYCSVGKMEGDVDIVWSSNCRRFRGNYPKVTINDANKVVIVYTLSDKIRYRIGQMTESCNSIGWYDEYEVCPGEYPSIAISGNNILLAYQAGDSCRYYFGQLEEASFKIAWNMQNEVLRNKVEYPSIAMRGDLAVALFIRGSKIFSIVGQVKDSEIIWCGKQESQEETSKQDSQEEDTEEGSKQDREDTELSSKTDQHEDIEKSSVIQGYYPCVAMFEDGVVIAAFQMSERVFVWSGKIPTSKGKIEWQDLKNDGHFAEGRCPSVAAVKSTDKLKIFIEMHSNKLFSQPKRFYYHECHYKVKL